MNKARIYEAIENPALLTDLSVGELEALRDAYPWFSAAQVLLAKAYQVKDDHRFTDQLRHAALYCGDRRSLRDFIALETYGLGQAAPTAITALVAEAPAEAPAEAEVRPGSQDESFGQEDQARAGELAHTILDDETARVELTAETAVALPHVPMRTYVPEEEQEEQEEKEQKEQKEKEEQEEQPAAGTAVSPAITPDTGTAEAEADPGPRMVDVRAMDELDKAILAEAISASIGLEASEEGLGLAESEPLAEQTVADKKAPISTLAPPESQDPFAAWLNRRSREIRYSEQTEEQDSPVASRNDPSVSFANPPVLRPEPLKDHQSSLIDRFIRMEPKITPGKSADYDTGNLARESLEEDFGLVTETMAILFARQGKLDRARKVYRRLIELHPEKSVYFAAQLKNLNANKKG
ncbi:MAG: hypothetical protein ACK505_00695 [Flavobacteriales bacterium]|jgi:hypothetical protein